ncbi:MAG: DCC1-like thiol-disulfide oxidoreductase family protein [Bacteroidales bacterium]|nr:DCC1-like thiol-disulfide oxidoreductase family protein [Bacteroidales bacterium]
MKARNVHRPQNNVYDQKNIILFDGICNLCNRSVQFIIRNDPDARFKFATLQSARGQTLLQAHPLVNNSSATVVYFKEGKAYVKSTAVLQVFKTLGWPFKILYVCMIIPKPVRDFLYDLVAKWRYQIFGKRIICMVPTKEIQSRFIE